MRTLSIHSHTGCLMKLSRRTTHSTSWSVDSTQMMLPCSDRINATLITSLCVIWWNVNLSPPPIDANSDRIFVCFREMVWITFLAAPPPLLGGCNAACLALNCLVGGATRNEKLTKTPLVKPMCNSRLAWSMSAQMGSRSDDNSLIAMKSHVRASKNTTYVLPSFNNTTRKASSDSNVKHTTTLAVLSVSGK